jgi:hypothetical protein
MEKQRNVLSPVQRANIQALIYFEDMTYNQARYASMREEQQAHFKQQIRDAEFWRRLIDPQREMLLDKKHNAKHRGIEFAITEADLDWPPHCPVTGVELRYEGIGLYSDRRGPRPDAATIDRIDNTRGYVPRNVVIVSHRVNSRKGDATLEQLRAIAAREVDATPELQRIADFYSSLV